MTVFENLRELQSTNIYTTERRVIKIRVILASDSEFYFMLEDLRIHQKFDESKLGVAFVVIFVTNDAILLGLNFLQRTACYS